MPFTQLYSRFESKHFIHCGLQAISIDKCHSLWSTGNINREMSFTVVYSQYQSRNVIHCRRRSRKFFDSNWLCKTVNEIISLKSIKSFDSNWLYMTINEIFRFKFTVEDSRVGTASTCSNTFDRSRLDLLFCCQVATLFRRQLASLFRSKIVFLSHKHKQRAEIAQTFPLAYVLIKIPYTHTSF